jgi:hypothetical protein
MQSNQHTASAKKPTNTPSQLSSSIADACNWQEMIKAWEQSDMTQKAFCKAHGLNYNSFAYQRGQLMQQASKIPPLLPVKISQPKQVATTTLATQCCIVQWPCGIKLTVPPGTDAATLKTLIAYLGEL